MTTAAGDRPVPPDNAEAIAAWDGPLFERFLAYRHIVATGLEHFGEAAMELHPPPRGGRVLDIGCGFGSTTRRLAELVGPEGAAVGVDAAPRFVAAAKAEAEAAGVANARFEVGDVQEFRFADRFDHAFSRMGTMFFADPVAAFRNVRRALAPGSRLVMTVWRAKAENPWMHRAQQITERFVTRPETSPEPTYGPGPFSMADADVTSGVLVEAGFGEVTLRRCDRLLKCGDDLDEAVRFAMDLGPAGEILRLQGERAAHLHDDVRQALREGLAEWAGPDGVHAPASAWIVSARAPAA